MVAMVFSLCVKIIDGLYTQYLLVDIHATRSSMHLVAQSPRFLRGGSNPSRQYPKGYYFLYILFFGVPEEAVSVAEEFRWKTNYVVD